MDSDSDSTDSSQSSDVYIPPRHPYPYRNPRLDSISRFVRSIMRANPEMAEQLITVSNSEASNDDTSESESGVGFRDNRTQNFDVELPTRHSYLGNDLTELSGYTMYDEGSIVSLPLLIQQHGAVALPGQALPLSLFHAPTIAMVRKAIDKDHMFGLVPAAQSVIQRNRSDSGEHPIVGAIGVTAEVYEHSNFDTEQRGYGVKARCRQRFKVIEVDAEHNGFAEHNWHAVAGRVMILPEKILPYLPNECRSRCHSRIPNAQKRRLHHAALTPWPSWVHQQYDETLLVKRMKKEMNSMCNAPSRSPKESGDVQSSLVTPDCPVALSFWVAQSLPLVDIQRVSLLQINSSIQRLRWELSFLSQCRWLCCQVCGSQLASTKDTFCMSVEGPQGTYVNPSGFVHETMTVKKAKNVVMIGASSGDYSWFPGYNWTIAQCKSCDTHVGWLFTSSKLSPSMFFGLSRSAIITLTLTCNKGGQFRTIM